MGPRGRVEILYTFPAAEKSETPNNGGLYRHPAFSRILMLKLLTALPFGNPRGIPGLIRLAE